MAKTTYINYVQTIRAASGNMVDIVTLKNGKVIGINSDSIVLYPSIADCFETPIPDENKISLYSDTPTIDRDININDIKEKQSGR
jgi:hypothetical protein